MLNHVQANIVLFEQQLANFAMWSPPRTESQELVYQLKQAQHQREQNAYRAQPEDHQFGNRSDPFEQPTPLSPVRKLIVCIFGFIISLLACLLGIFSIILLIPISFPFECFDGFHHFGRCFTPFWIFCCRSTFIASWSRNIGNWFQRIGDGPDFFLEAQQVEEGRAGGGNHDSNRHPGPDGANGDRRSDTATQPTTVGHSTPVDIRAANNAADSYTETDHAVGADEAIESIPLKPLANRHDAAVELKITSEPSSPDVNRGACSPTEFV
jgi:hypothetical protein